jgi:alpha-D-ribose 1-methylphosphonate 5-triphosphate synthase subunit PhnH
VNLAASTGPLASGFQRPAWDSQAVFRSVLEAMSYPGRIALLSVTLEVPAPLELATAAVCLALLDYETAIWVQPGPGAPAIHTYLRFHCGCPAVESPEKADFALALQPQEAPALETFAQGSAEQPHRSATVILQIANLEGGAPMTLRGPGIADTQVIRPAGLASHFWQQWRRNSAQYPLGVDVILTSGARLAALPRTVQVEA